MKIAICLGCDQKMRPLTNLLWCTGCDLIADKRILDETVKCQAWEIARWPSSVYWHRVKPYERKSPKRTQVMGFKANV